MRHELALRADTSDTVRLNAWLDDAFQSGGLADRLQEDMKLCLNEAFCNVVLYAFDDQPDPRISLVLTVDPDAVTALLSDNGKPFDPLKHPRKPKFEDLADAVPGGFGVQLIRDTASHVGYERIDGWNRLHIVCGQPVPAGNDGSV